MPKTKKKSYRARLADKKVYDRGKISQSDETNEFKTNKVRGKDSQLDKKHEQVKIVHIVMLILSQLAGLLPFPS